MPVDTPFRRDRATLGVRDPVSPDQASAGISDTVLRTIAKDPHSDAVAVALVNRVANEFELERVSLGVRRSRLTQLKAVSDQVKLDTKRAEPKRLTAVLEETLAGPSPMSLSMDNIEQFKDSKPAHSELLHHRAGRASLSFTVQAKQFPYAFLMEFDSRELPLHAELERIQEAVGPSIAILDVLIDQEQSRWQSFTERSVKFLHALSRGTLSMRQSLAVAALSLVAISFVFPVTAKVTSRATIVAADSQLIVAPQDGFVKSSSYRAGDTVKAGDLLATLDNRDIRLTADKWQSEARKNQQSQAQALASRDRIELGRLRADRLRIDAELALVDRQLQRAELRAPFDGVITQGDLTQSLGAAVEHGALLFTVAKSGDYRLELDVNEHDVALVDPGQSLGVRLSSAPGTGLSASIEELLPVAQSDAGVSTFRVQAKLVDPPAFLRPGMEGIAKIDVGSQPAMTVYTRKLRNALRLWAWKLGLL